MLKTNSLATIVFCAVATIATAASAETRIDRRQDNQERRIDQGARDGTLTRGEARRLERGQDRIDRAEDRAQRDGYVDPYERSRIEHMQDVESRRIQRQRNDRQYGY